YGLGSKAPLGRDGDAQDAREHRQYESSDVCRARAALQGEPSRGGSDDEPEVCGEARPRKQHRSGGKVLFSLEYPAELRCLDEQRLADEAPIAGIHEEAEASGQRGEAGRERTRKRGATFASEQDRRVYEDRDREPPEVPVDPLEDAESARHGTSAP